MVVSHLDRKVLDLNKDNPQWETIKDSMMKSSSYLNCVSVNNLLYVMGGFNDDDGVTDASKKHDITMRNISKR